MDRSEGSARGDPRALERALAENRRLADETSAALERQTATAEILRLIAGSPSDVQPVLDGIASSAARFCAAENVTVALLRDGHLHGAAAHGSLPGQLGHVWLADRGSVTGRSVVDGRTIHVVDLQAESAEEYPTGKAIASEFGHRTVLSTPLLREGVAIGALVLRRDEARRFTAQQIQLVETFAAQAVIAIENVRLFNQTREALERQTAVSEILRVIAGSPTDVQPVVDAIADSAARFCGAENVSVILQREDELLHPSALVGPLRSRVAPFPLSRDTVTGRSMLEGQPIQVDDLQAEGDEYPLGSEQARALGYRTTLATPLMRGRRAFGAILLRRAERRPFTTKQIDLVRTFADQAVIAIENVRLFNETKEALERQTAVSEILRVIAGSPTDVQPVLDAIAESAARFCGAENVSVILQRDDGLLYPSAHIGTLNAAVPPFPLSRETVTGRSMLEGRPVHVHDLHAESDEYPLGSAQARAMGHRTTLATPLTHGGRTFGAILMRRAEVRPFTEHQIELVQTFADQAVIAIENVRLFNETKEALERQTAISAVLGTISRSAFDLRAILDTVVQNAVRLCDARGGLIFRRDGDVYRFAAVHGSTPEFAKYFEDDRFPPVRPGPGTLTGRVVVTKRPEHVLDLEKDPLYAYGEANRIEGTRTALGVPLLHQGEPIGAMSLWRNEVRAFSESEIELVQTFADQAAIAIENVRLFNETKEALDQQTATSEVLQAISRSAFDLQSVLDTVVERAAQLCGAEQAWMRRIEGDEFRFSAYYGASSELRAMFEELRLDGALAKIDQSGMGGRAVMERRPIHIHDIAADDALREASLARRGGGRTALAVPMLRDGEPIGAIVVARNRVAPFSEREIRLVETFADQAVIAIENVRLFSEIQDKSRQLEIAGRHKSEFLANMSHELRTPLNAIIGFSEVLLQGMFGELNEKQREYQQDVLSSGRHLLSLINDILDLSKIEAGRVELELGEFSLPAALDNGVTMVRERAARHGIRVTVEVDGVDLIVADERKVKQIVANLLSNAVKFTPDGGRVEVRAARANGEVRIAVRDTGIGIDAVDRERIFLEFQQASRDPERSREGTGLGLALSKRYVELHGGRIWVESEVGQGSTFTFSLPLVAAGKEG